MILSTEGDSLRGEKNKGFTSHADRPSGCLVQVGVSGYTYTVTVKCDSDLYSEITPCDG